jgi:hypothetical protein
MCVCVRMRARIGPCVRRKETRTHTQCVRSGSVYAVEREGYIYIYIYMHIYCPYHRIGGDDGVEQALAEEHAVGHVLDLGLLGGAVLEADGVAHLRVFDKSIYISI